MYFKTTLEFGPEVHYALRSLDKDGVYVTIEQYYESRYIMMRTHDTLGELATDTHVMNIPVDANMIKQQAKYWEHLEPTHVRLDPDYMQFFKGNYND
jgi:hypothetical protein